MAKSNNRIALFSPVLKGLKDWLSLTGLISDALKVEYKVDIYSRDGKNDSFPYHEFTWRHLKQPYSLNIYNLQGGEDYSYMLPFVFTHPGLVVLRRYSIATDLWRMHTLDSTEEDFISEMIFNYGRIGEMVGQLMWRKMWGEALERKYPMFLLLAEGSLWVSAFDDWIVSGVRGESASERLSLLPPPFEPVTKPEDNDRLNLITLYTEEHPLLLGDIAEAAGDLVGEQNSTGLTVISDEHYADDAKKILSKNKMSKSCTVLVPGKKGEIEKAFKEADLFLFLEDPAYPTEVLPLYFAASTGCTSVVTDTRARLDLPEDTFPRYRFRDRKKGLLSLLRNISETSKKAKSLNEKTVKWYKKLSKAAGADGINPFFTDEICKTAACAIAGKSGWSRPVDYPAHLHDYSSRLEASIRDRLEGFPASEKIDEAIRFIINSK